jgi:hypothetical protein
MYKSKSGCSDRSHVWSVGSRAPGAGRSSPVVSEVQIQKEVISYLKGEKPVFGQKRYESLHM